MNIAFNRAKPLHDSHKAVLSAILAYTEKYRIAPAVRDIADSVHKAPNAVVESILALERAGHITCLSRGGRRISRGILVNPSASQVQADQAES
jgi:hypothetical protein